MTVRGPAIVEQYDTTTYVPEGFEVAGRRLAESDRREDP